MSSAALHARALFSVTSFRSSLPARNETFGLTGLEGDPGFAAKRPRRLAIGRQTGEIMIYLVSLIRH